MPDNRLTDHTVATTRPPGNDPTRTEAKWEWLHSLQAGSTTLAATHDSTAAAAAHDANALAATRGSNDADLLIVSAGGHPAYPEVIDGAIATTADAGTVLAASPASTVTITGSGGITFDVGFDQADSALPTGFKSAVSAAFQYFADTFTASTFTAVTPVTLYYDVGYGEVGGGNVGGLGASSTYFGPGQTYSTYRSHLASHATTAVDYSELANDVPASDPTGGRTLDMAVALEKALGLASPTSGAGSSLTSPDGYIGFSSAYTFNYSLDRAPVTGQYDFIGVVEHEISEVMGRFSMLGNSGAASTTTYTPLDLLRYSAPGTRQLAAYGDPSYFSIDGGAHAIYAWNNFQTGNTGDLGDWAGTSPYTPDAFNDNSNPGVTNLVTSRDIALMDALGWNRVSGSTYTASAGQTVSGDVIYSGDTLNVASGGTAVGTMMLEGGYAFVSSGGAASGTTVSGGYLNVESGGTVVGTTVLGYGGVGVGQGGAASGTTISGGYQYVYGTASGTTVDSGGEQYIYGTASATTVNGGGVAVVGGFGGGGTANGTDVKSGGALIVVPGGSATNTTAEAGSLVISSGVVLLSGTQVLSDTPSTSGFVLSDYDEQQWVLPGGTTTATTVSSGDQIVYSGGMASGTTLSAYGYQDIYGGTASGTNVGSNGSQSVESGGTAVATTVAGVSATQSTDYGGTNIGTTVANGGQEFVWGGTTVNTIIRSGGTQNIVYGVVTGTTVSNGGTQTVGDNVGFFSGSGTASGTVISGGGSETVSSGSTAVDTIVRAGGLEVVSSGGSTSATVISGGLLDLKDGASAVGSVTFAAGVSGGALKIDDLTMPSATISGLAPGQTIDLAAISGGGTGTVTLLSGNELQISEGGNTYNFNLDPSQDFSNDAFRLTNDAGSGTAITVSSTVYPPPADFGATGHSDVVWRNSTSGDVGLWNSASGYSFQDLGTVHTDWTIQRTGDFNGDGKADILWRNTAGDTGVWDSGASGFTYQDLGTVHTDWVIQGTGDFNGDGKADILWRNSTTGDVGVWNSGASGGFDFQDLGVVHSDWVIQSQAYGL